MATYLYCLDLNIGTICEPLGHLLQSELQDLDIPKRKECQL